MEDTTVTYRLRLEQDRDPQSPEEWGNTDVFLVANIPRNLEVAPPTHEGKRLSDDPRALVELGYLVFPVRGYVHSGVALSLPDESGRSGYPFDDLFDSGWAGFVAVHPRAFTSDTDESTKAWREHYHPGKTDDQIARVMAASEIATWNQYLSGDIWGYIVERVTTCDQGDEHAEQVDSCWGYYGQKDAQEQGELVLKAYEDEAAKEAAKAAPSPVRTMLDVSTAHMPSAEPDFGDVRHFRTGFGYVVFTSSPDSGADGVPEWLRPLWQFASLNDCLVINFDQDATRYPQFPSWEW